VALGWVSVGIENPVHLLFIAVVALVVLGPKRLPALARALGQAVREFRASLEEKSESAAELEPSAPASGGEQAMGKPTRPPGQAG
jgi:TatA/E family protein of Tat protein translocase